MAAGGAEIDTAMARVEHDHGLVRRRRSHQRRRLGLLRREAENVGSGSCGLEALAIGGRELDNESRWQGVCSGLGLRMKNTGRRAEVEDDPRMTRRELAEPVGRDQARDRRRVSAAAPAPCGLRQKRRDTERDLRKIDHDAVGICQRKGPRLNSLGEIENELRALRCGLQAHRGRDNAVRRRHRDRAHRRA